MLCVTWNVRGMNDPFKIKEIKNFLYSHKVAVCALLETRVREQNANKVQGKLGKDWKWLNNYSHSARGRIWIGWRPAWVNVTLTHTQEQLMVCDIQDQSHKIKMVAVYGLHTIADRKSLWSGLLQCVQQQDPMIIIGDFNAVCHSNDRLHGTLITDAETEDFQQFLLQSNLIESRSTGSYYSWSNSSIGSDRVLSRIDKAYVNLVWLGMYAEVSVQYLPPGISDHSPLLFNLMTGRPQGGKPFKFMNVMAEQDEFLETVEKAWSSVNGRFKLQAVWLKLKAVKRELKQMKTQKIGLAHESEGFKAPTPGNAESG
ncbi:uncharacterized protein LOC104901201 [Beta vulgaris subsp. vulgaris]|uniref:uncharacterized protein LOC104901201 n=1 Tax=Beta vulgaris subsp. vulgaris TaxID=3555 RepID=UPI000540264C|nr:uncharacterized protein LOC104901201 [Beta vulgaris subsp. vulgaris]